MKPEISGQFFSKKNTRQISWKFDSGGVSCVTDRQTYMTRLIEALAIDLQK
jgi:hypothetical protein